jgi:hypothetical protein
MARKELEFQLKMGVDQASVTTVMESIKNQWTKLTSSLPSLIGGKAGQPGGVSAATTEAFQKRMNQPVATADKAVAEEFKNQEKIVKALKERNAAMKDLEKIASKLAKGSQEELENQQKITKEIKEQAKLKEQFHQQEKQTEQAQETKENARDTAAKGAGGGEPPAAGGGGKGKGFFGKKGVIPGIAGGIGTIGAIASQIADVGSHLSGLAIRSEQARGSAINNTVGADLERTYSGKSPFEAQWMKERGAASGMAEEKKDKSRFWDKVGGYGKMIGGGALMAGGAVVGAASLAGVPFTAGGSALGLGVAGSMIAGGGAMMHSGATNDRQYSAVFDKKRHEELLVSQQGEDFRKTLEALKDQDPYKKQGLERFERNMMSDVGTQRTLGLSDYGMYGGQGLLRSANQAGFMGDQAQQMGKGIVGAGGSARGITGQSVLGLQMERSGMTNASQILGSMGHSMGPEASKRATIEIMSQAFKTGLDGSDFAEENRRFTQAAAAVIGRSGATTAEDQDRIIKSLTSFMGERTNRGTEAAQGAYEKSQQRGSDITGRRGAMRLSMAQSDPNLSKLSAEELTEVLGARPEELKENDPMIQYMADKAGLKPGEFLDRLKNTSKKSRFLNPAHARMAEESSKVIDRYAQESGSTFTQLMEEANKPGNDLPKDVIKHIGRLKAVTSMEETDKYRSSDVTAKIGEFIPGAEPTKPEEKQKTPQEKIMDRLENIGDKMADIFTAKGAKGEALGTEALINMKDEMVKAAGGAEKLAISTNEAATALHNFSQLRTPTLPQGDPQNKSIVDTILGQSGAHKGANMSTQPTTSSGKYRTEAK